MKIKRKHTKSIEAILNRINDLEWARGVIDEELAELMALVRDHKFNLSLIERDLDRAGIAPAYDNWPGIKAV